MAVKIVLSINGGTAEGSIASIIVSGSDTEEIIETIDKIQGGMAQLSEEEK